MSSALGISAVTAVLQYFLNEIYNAVGIGAVAVTALAPDVVELNRGSATNTALQVNVFLHQVTTNAAWRNIGLPSLAADGATRTQNQPLALDLHYLLTAYAADDTVAEALLGYGIMMLHENPIVARADVTFALTHLPVTTNPLAGLLNDSGLADQIEMIKIAAATMGREELAWIWTALKADYRPTFPFQVSTVLIEPQHATSLALPVLSRNIVARAGPSPQVLVVEPPNRQTASAPGDLVTLSGNSLAGATEVVLTNRRLGIDFPPFAPASAGADEVSFVVPDDPANLPAGVYDLTLRFTDSGGNVLKTSNTVPFGLAPMVVIPPAPTVTTNPSGRLVTLNLKPRARPGQAVSLVLNDTSALAEPFAAPASQISFQFPALPAGQYLARLLVDGVASPISIDWIANPPAFLGPMVTL